MKTNKIGVLFLVSVLALAGIGISYAGWIDQITVTGTVNTGYVRYDVTEYSGTWVWKQISTHLKDIHHGIPIDYDGDLQVDDDPAGHYGDPDYELVAWSYCHNSVPSEQLHFKFVNLYPCVDFKADFKFTIGTIPVILTATDLLWTIEKVNGVNQFWIHGINPPTHPAPTVSVTITYTDQAGVVHQVYPGAAPIQLHPYVTYTWQLLIHIPQDNVYMNAYAEGACSMNIVQWSDQCGYVPGPEKVLTLPTGIVNAIFTHWGPSSYWDTYLTGLTGGPYSPPLANDVHCVGWCVDEDTYIVPGLMYTINLMSSYDPGNPWADPDWPKVNYIINHKTPTGYTTPADKYQIQYAIWYFLNHGYSGSDPKVLAMIADANANGGTFVPQTGDMIAVLCVPDPEYQHGYHMQHTFIEVDP